MKRYIFLLTLFASLAAGCQKTELSDPAGSGSGYNTRVTFLISLLTEESDAASPSMTRVAAPEISDLWYAVFDAASGKLIPASDGTTTRHLTLAGDLVPAIEELLPPGSYRLSFLAMASGGDANAIQSLAQSSDPWLKVAGDGTLPGDFLFGQGTAKVAPAQDNTVAVELRRAVSQFRVNLALSGLEQTARIHAVALCVTEGSLYGALTADGSLLGTATATDLDLTSVRERYLLCAATEAPCKGNVLLTLTGSDGKKYLRSYPFDLRLKAGARTTFNLTLNLPYDALDILTSDDIKNEVTMFADDESYSVMQDEQRRSFNAQAPLRVTKKDNNTNYIQFYSTKGIGRTEIYARIKSTKDYFKVYELDTIKPFSEIIIPGILLNSKVITSVTQDGKIVKVPTTGLTWNHFEFLCVNKTSEYWKRFGNGTAQPNFKFRIFGLGQTGQSAEHEAANYMNVTPVTARKMVVMALNWGHLFSSDEFLEEVKLHVPYYIDVKDATQADGKRRISASPEEMSERVMKVEYITFVLQRPGAGVEGQGGAGIGMVCLPEDQYTTQIPTDNPSYGSYFVKFHEFAHVMGFPDNYDAPSGSANTITNRGGNGWPKACNEAMLRLATAKDLPVTSTNELDAIYK